MSPSRRPEPKPSDREPPAPACPHCGSTEVELEAPFGSSLMTRQYYCKSCRTVFEQVKWEPGPAADWLDD